MQFDSIAEIIHMNGHGLYVWVSYAVALGVFGYNILSPLLARGDINKKLQRQARRELSEEGEQV